MNTAFRLAVEFWGVRGSVATPEHSKLRYGGNTTCISARSATGQRLIVDAGTGIRALGHRMVAEGISEANIFFTHFHWDHIQGLPFFAPLFREGNTVRFHAAVTAGELQRKLERQMSDPYFTLDFNATRSHREFVHVAGEGFKCGDFTVVPFTLNHPQGASGYRIESGGASFVVATDVEHGHPALDRELRKHAAHADVLIYDAQYTEAEYASRAGWGHSTCTEAAHVAADAGVKRLVLFHHDPDHEDKMLDQLVTETQDLFAHTDCAQEGMTLLL